VVFVRALPVLVLAAVLLVPLAGAGGVLGTAQSTLGPVTGGTVLVGFEPGKEKDAFLAIQAGGGQVKRTSPELHVALVHHSDPVRFVAHLLASPGIAFVEGDDRVQMAGTQWNGAQWNGAQWNGAEWNGAQWNGAQWNGNQWNGAGVQGAQWNSDKDAYMRGSTAADPGLVWQWGVWATKAPHAWPSHTGERDAPLCVLDSGIAWDHPDLRANAWTDPATGAHGWNAIDGTSDAYDDAGHGTHVAGIAGAAVQNAYGVAGMGNVSLQAVKVLDSTGNGHESDLAFGLAWCADHGAKVAVMALGVTERGPTLERALSYAVSRDVLLVASAGNEGCDGCVGYPASDARVVAVGALDVNLTAAPFSSRGGEVDLAAPGVDVLSTFPGARFAYGSGTSQAVGFVAGVAALVRDADATLDAHATRRVLESTAQDVGASGRDDASGHGLVRTDRAVAQALS